MIIFNSIWDTENGECIERNMHEDIKKHCSGFDENATSHFEAIETEISKLKNLGFDVVYSAKVDSRIFDNSQKV